MEEAIADWFSVDFAICSETCYWHMCTKEDRQQLAPLTPGRCFDSSATAASNSALLEAKISVLDRYRILDRVTNLLILLHESCITYFKVLTQVHKIYANYMT